jgi:OOP family OmpA-OmpF porin
MGESADLADLRDLIVGPEQRRIDRLQARLDDPDARARDVGEVLPNVLLQHAQDPHFTRAMAPPIEKALTASVRRDPKPLADALFPVMGPAIRKAVAAALSGMVDSLNRTLEHSLSWKSIQWRLEARRTGRSFGEVILLKTLVYRVEQVFLIDRKTGLLLQHAHHGDDVQDADMVSGMLTAIRDFVHDSFKVAESDALESLKVGDLSVWIEPGPHAVLAAVIRGAAPREYRQTLVDAVETIHLQFGEPLEAFNGDATPLADARSILEGCLESRFRPEEKRPKTRIAWSILGVIAIAGMIWAVLAYRANTRWMAFLTALRAEPGLVVVQSTREDGRYVVTGMRDPLARDPQSLLPAGLAATAVEGRWSPFYSLDPAIVAARAQAVLRPPAGVTFNVRDGVLETQGPVTLEWVAEASRLAPLLPGITRYDAAAALAGMIADTTKALESRPVLFAKGAASPLPTERAALEALVTDLRRLDAIAAAAGARFTITIVGHTDNDGAPESNLPLSRARANAVMAVVNPANLPRLTVAAEGVGSSQPATANPSSEADNQRNRRVAVRVTREGT